MSEEMKHDDEKNNNSPPITNDEVNVEEDKELLPSYTVYKGDGNNDDDEYRMPKGFPVNGYIEGLNYKARSNDLFVATYPKCGTTWMQHIVYMIVNDGQPLSSTQKLDNEFPHLEELGDTEYFTATTTTTTTNDDDDVTTKKKNKYDIRLIKTHLPYSKTPQNSNSKYICVVRNPKDCIVSFFHHTRGFVKHYNFNNGSFDTYFNLFINGLVDFGCYYKCLRSWLDHKNDKNVLIITYEQLRSNTKDTIIKVATFINPILYPQRLIENNEYILNEILKHTTIDSMKLNPQRWSSLRPKHHTPFIRKGSLGGWKELLTIEQCQLLDDKMIQTCTKEELNFLGEKYYKS